MTDYCQQCGTPTDTGFNCPKGCKRTATNGPRITKMKRFFSYNDQDTFELHDTLAEAKAAAEEALEDCRDEARCEGGWPECVDEICYGELRGHVIESSCEPWDTDKHGTAPDGVCEHVVYTLQDLPQEAHNGEG